MSSLSKDIIINNNITTQCCSFILYLFSRK
uniref:Uncharacterized protein n=1 Tax=Lepeophtheirus salmonis TaxID=72036 RepID=A0A0K2SVC1_LEPSM